MNKRLSDLLRVLPTGLLIAASNKIDEIEIKGITDDSRQVQAGYIFVAYAGVESDGHSYISAAVRRGAVAVVAEKEWQCETENMPMDIRTHNGREAFAWLCAAWHNFPSRSMKIVGVTGTDGKTSTANLIYSILKNAGYNAGMISTVNAVIGDRVLDTGLHTTTPDADEIQQYLAQMQAAGTTHCVLEVTSHGLAHHRVDGTQFDIAVLTNITSEHLDLHGTRENYRAAKARLFGIADQHVLNADDAYSYEFLRKLPAQRRLVYAKDRTDTGDVRATHVAYLPNAMRIGVACPLGLFEVSTPLLGDFNVSNILAAISTALLLQIPIRAIQKGIAALQGVAGRMARVRAGQDYLAVVDFAHTPNSLQNCLRTLRKITPGKLMVVFGCAGERDPNKRAPMGRIAAEIADVVVMTAEDPRREDVHTILAQVEAGARTAQSGATLIKIADRRQALHTACRLAQAGDTVVACGKGHEQSMCFGSTEIAWDERAELRGAIRATG